ncbi:MAG: hypothetical protein V4519_04805 [Patescibacteria group bacterium]
MLDILEKLFGSAAKVKIMRLFLFNNEESYDIDHVIERSKVTPTAARQELSLLEKMGMLKKKSFFRDVEVGRGKNKKIERHRVMGWTLDYTFEYLDPLKNLLVHVSEQRNQELLRKLARVGKLKLVIISGFFIQNWDSRVDLLVVGDNLRKGTLENVVRTLESELGKEIRYASFETADFQYRLGVYDKLVRDILDYEHEIILDKINVAAR